MSVEEDEERLQNREARQPKNREARCKMQDARRWVQSAGLGVVVLMPRLVTQERANANALLGRFTLKAASHFDVVRAAF